MRMRAVSWNNVLIAILLHMLTFISITGCATERLSERVIPLGESELVEDSDEVAIPLYYNFQDVPVPMELEIRREKSFVFQTAKSTVGLISFSGNLESEFLISFFIDKMPEDGWGLLSSFKSPKNILFFLKENRFCIITIISKTFTTEVEILLTPSFQKSQ